MPKKRQSRKPQGQTGRADTLLDRIAESLSDLSKSERRVAEFLLSKPQQVVTSSVKDIALDLEVSEPTIIRFCRRVGCQGFKDFKIVLAQDLAVRQALHDAGTADATTPSPAAAARVAAAGKSDDFVDQLAAGAQTALEKVRAELDRSALKAASRLIADAARVFIYGLGGSSSMLASEAHNRLFRLNVPSVPYTDSYMQRMAAATLGRRDVALFISSTGRPRALLDSVELAKYYGAKCIGITPSDSPLGRELDICLDLRLTQSGVDQIQPNPMRYAQLFIVDCLAYRVASDLGDPAKKALTRSRASVASLHGIAPQQPIGD